ncbi:twin-arginine translocation signal domain-containing protein [Halomicrococcus sp. NG-SE-24]|uniref:twin-arginine translocation signal domain-containing protein n=1 Tax=Halomicrococcus sp. NG-SE-24 TaxID=3436928 RepID=UPI003D96052B
MTDERNEERDATDGAVSRRTVLKGTTAAGVAGGLLSGQASGHPKPRTITVKALTVPARYRFTVSGEVARRPSAGASDEIRGHRTVLGRIDTKGELDEFKFSGEITSFEILKGDVDVVVDGKRVEKKRTKKAKEPALPNGITIQAEGEDVSYRFRVTGRVRKGPNADGGDSVVDGTKVSGAVGGRGTDDYRYSGSLVFDSTEGPLTVTLELDQ